MSLEKALTDLQLAFDTVAHEVQAQFPLIWNKAAQLYTDQNNVIDTDAIVRFLIKENYAGWGGKSLVEVAEEFGEEAVINYIDAIDAGVYV